MVENAASSSRQQLVRVPIFPAVIAQGSQAPLHPILKAADGVEPAHLVIQFPQHGAGLVEAEKDLCRQRQQKGRQPQRDPLFQRH